MTISTTQREEEEMKQKEIFDVYGQSLVEGIKRHEGNVVAATL